MNRHELREAHNVTARNNIFRHGEDQPHQPDGSQSIATPQEQEQKLDRLLRWAMVGVIIYGVLVMVLVGLIVLLAWRSL